MAGFLSYLGALLLILCGAMFGYAKVTRPEAPPVAAVNVVAPTPLKKKPVIAREPAAKIVQHANKRRPTSSAVKSVREAPIYAMEHPAFR